MALTKEFLYTYFTHSLRPNMPEELVRRMLAEYEHPDEAYLACYFVRNTLPKDMPEDEKIKIAKANIPNKNTVYIKVGEYTIKPTSGDTHPEAVLQHDICDKDGKQIATFNFYFIPPNKIVINHIQGIRKGEQDLLNLSKSLKENWRIFIVELIKRYASDKGLVTFGKLPSRFYLTGPENQTEYRRILRQYLQAYINGGIPIENIIIEKVHKSHRKWLETNLRTKRERKTENPKVKRVKPKRGPRA